MGAELRVHFEPTTWKAYDDTFKEHPVIAIIGNIIQAFKVIGSKTLVIPARFVIANDSVSIKLNYV